MWTKWIDRKTALVLAAGLLIGILIGWLVIGWWLWPVHWIDADPWDMRQAHKEAYIAMTADSLANNGDAELAQQRLRSWDRDELSQILGNLIEDRLSRQLNLEAQHLDDLRVVLGLTLPTGEETAPAEEPAPPPAEPSFIARWLPVCLIVLVVLLLAVAAIGFLSRRRPRGRPAVPVPPPVDWEPVEGLVPLRRYVATYRLGDAAYDESFSIEDPNGDFLGECGMAIGETLQEGASDRVTALEIWLFDKDDIRTVTKVLMSEWAFNDDQMRSLLVAKGEPVLAVPGQEVVLETDKLQVKATIREVAYGSEPPALSYFERFVVDLDTSMKPSEADE